MEAMSVERILLSAWEEEGFVGRCRVPIGMSDLDVVAYRIEDDVLRIGELKATDSSDYVYVLDDHHLASFDADDGIRGWLKRWSGWLDNLPSVWGEDGKSRVPWLPSIDRVRRIEVVFVSNSEVFADEAAVNRELTKSVEVALKRHARLAARIAAEGLTIDACMKGTADVIVDLAAAVRGRIRNGYHRRFGDPFKDLIRELNRFVHPYLSHIPRDTEGKKGCNRKAKGQQQVRQRIMDRLLEALAVKRVGDEWVASEVQPGEVIVEQSRGAV